MTDIDFSSPPGCPELSDQSLELYRQHVWTEDMMIKVIDHVCNTLLFGSQLMLATEKTRRRMICPNCEAVIDFDFLRQKDCIRYDNGIFTGTCPYCSQKTSVKGFQVSDSYDNSQAPNFVDQDLRGVATSYNSITGTVKVALYPSRMPRLKASLNNQEPAALADTPKVVLDVLRDDEALQLTNTSSYLWSTCNPLTYRKEDFRGWGMPKYMACYDDVITLLMIDAFARKICKERILPGEIISPDVSGMAPSTPDMIQNMINPQNFEMQIRRITDTFKNGMTGTNRTFTMPFPIKYTMLGGDAKALFPVEMVQFYYNRVMDTIGIPPEIRNTSGGPGKFQSSLPYYDKSAVDIRCLLNQTVNFMANRIGKTFKLPPVKAEFLPVDRELDQTSMMGLDRAYGEKNLSHSTYFRRVLGIKDPLREMRRRIWEDQKLKEYMDEVSLKDQKKQENRQALGIAAESPGAQVMNDEQQAADAQGQAPAGQAPAGGQPSAPVPQSMLPGGDPEVKQFLAQAGYDPQKAKSNDSAKYEMANTVAMALLDVGTQGTGGLGLNQKVLRYLDNVDPEFKQYVMDLKDKNKGGPPQQQ